MTGEMFSYIVTRNLLLSLSVKEFLKLQTKIRVVPFFPDTVYFKTLLIVIVSNYFIKTTVTITVSNYIDFAVYESRLALVCAIHRRTPVEHYTSTKTYKSNSVTFFSERELTFTFAICYRPSVCRLSVVCLQRSCTLLRRFKFSAIFLRYLVP